MTTKLKSVYEYGALYRNTPGSKELAVIQALREDRHTIYMALREGIEAKHVREMQPNENRAKYLAFVRGEEHMRKKALTLLDELFGVSK